MAMMHPKVFRAIECIARYHATQEAKEQIRHRGEKVSDHAPREINIIAHLLLVTRPQEFVDRGKASAVVKEVEAKIEAQARGALGRNSKDLEQRGNPQPTRVPAERNLCSKGRSNDRDTPASQRSDKH